MSLPDDPSDRGGPATEPDATDPGQTEGGIEVVGGHTVEHGDPEPGLGMEAGLDLGSMMQMAQDMSERMETAQAELSEARIEGSAGGGLVKVTLNGHLHLLSVEVAPGASDPEDPSVVGDLVVAAWRDAHDEVARLQAAADPLGGLGGDLGGLGGLLGGG